MCPTARVMPQMWVALYRCSLRNYLKKARCRCRDSNRTPLRALFGAPDKEISYLWVAVAVPGALPNYIESTGPLLHCQLRAVKNAT